MASIKIKHFLSQTDAEAETIRLICNELGLHGLKVRRHHLIIEKALNWLHSSVNSTRMDSIWNGKSTTA